MEIITCPEPGDVGCNRNLCIKKSISHLLIVAVIDYKFMTFCLWLSSTVEKKVEKSGKEG